MRLTTKSEYSLLALIYLAKRGGEEYSKIGPICEYYHIPKKYLEQLFTTLKNNGIIKTKRGATGGYRLAIPADEITVARIIRLMDGAIAPSDSVSRYFYNETPIAKEENLLGLFKEIRDCIAHRLENTFISDIV